MGAPIVIPLSMVRVKQSTVSYCLYAVSCYYHFIIGDIRVALFPKWQVKQLQFVK